MITGRIEKYGRWWTAHSDLAGIYTQGRSETDAREMLASAFEDVVNTPGFKVTVTPVDDEGGVVVEANEPGKLLAVALRYQREIHKLSLADVATKAGASSRSIYARLEQGGNPTIETLLAALAVVAPGVTLALVERKPARKAYRIDAKAGGTKAAESRPKAR